MRGIAGLILWMLGVGFVIMHASCNNEEKVQEPEFYYYPKANVYYDVAGKVFYYSLNGAKSWQQMTDSLATSPELLGEKVVLHSSDTIWKDNERHRQLYSGVLYNVAASVDSVEGSAAKVSERKVNRKKYRASERPAPEEEPKKKKGFGKFLQKVFGKKKDK